MDGRRTNGVETDVGVAGRVSRRGAVWGCGLVNL